jgi:hypothetical protein
VERSFFVILFIGLLVFLHVVFCAEDQHKQLRLILSIVGKPTDEELTDIGVSEWGRAAVRSLPKYQRADLANTFPGAPKEGTYYHLVYLIRSLHVSSAVVCSALDLLQCMLRLHPGQYLSTDERRENAAPAPTHHRITAAEALKHSFFHDIVYPTQHVRISGQILNVA